MKTRPVFNVCLLRKFILRDAVFCHDVEIFQSLFHPLDVLIHLVIVLSDLLFILKRGKGAGTKQIVSAMFPRPFGASTEVTSVWYFQYPFMGKL